MKSRALGRPTRRVFRRSPGAGVLLPALDLNFVAMAASRTLDSRLTFSRASLAMEVGPDGLLRWCDHNLLPLSELLTDPAWAKSTMTVTGGASDPLGGTTAWVLTATGANGYLLRSSLSTAGQTYSSSCWIRRRAGTGTVRLARADGSAFFDVTVTSNWAQVSSLLYSAGGPGAFGVQLVTSGDAVDVWRPQVNLGPLTAYCPNTTYAAYYGPRWQYDPVTLSSLGALLEAAQATNLLTYSQDFTNAAWGTNGLTVTSVAETGPGGSATSQKWIEDTSGFHRIFATRTWATGSHTFSFYAKASGRDRIFLYADGGLSTATVNFTTRSAISLTGGATAVFSDGPLGYTRIAITWNQTTTNSQTVQVWLHNGVDRNYTGDGVSGIYAYGAQLEASPVATSYIPTTASTVTRAADSLTLTGTGFSSWWNSTAATLVWEGAINRAGTADFLVATAGGSIGESLGVYASGSSPVAWMMKGFSAQVASTLAYTFTPGQPFKVAVAFEQNNSAGCVNGGTVTADTACLMPVGIDRLSFTNAGGPGGTSMLGAVSRLRAFASRLPNATLQALTT